MSPRRKPASPEKIAAIAAERRLAEKVADRNPEAWGANVEAMAMPANGDVEFFPAGRGERSKPARRISGLDWLKNKGRLTDHEYHAGVRYGDDYRAAFDVRIRSCANDDVGGGDFAAAQEARADAQVRHGLANEKALSGHREMVVACKLVLGEGMTVRSIAPGDDIEVAKKETAIVIALGLLAKHYGMF